MTLPTLNKDLLQFTFSQIWENKVKHDQTSFYCGTSACIAGWALLFSDYETELSEIPLETFEKDVHHLTDTYDRFSVGNIAKERLGLTYSEAGLMFDANTNKLIHQRMLDNLLKDIRIPDNLDPERPLPDTLLDDIEAWYNPNIAINVSISDFDSNTHYLEGNIQLLSYSLPYARHLANYFKFPVMFDGRYNSSVTDLSNKYLVYPSKVGQIESTSSTRVFSIV